jgi:cullin-associated NEDD8-dissociated protein 1
VSPANSDADLHLSRLVLDVTSSILIAHPAITDQVSKVVLSRVLEFLKSPMLQGQALSSVVKLFQNFLQAKETSYSSLLGTLLAVVDEKLSLTQALPVAQCVAAIAKKTTTLSSGNSVLLKETVDGFVKTVSDTKATPHAKMVALLTIGEIGRDTNLTAHKSYVFISYRIGLYRVVSTHL